MPYRVTGKALSTLGAPLEGAQVCITARQAPYQSLGRPITDANGEFSQDVGEFSDQVRVTGHLNGVKSIIDFDQPEFYQGYVAPLFTSNSGSNVTVVNEPSGFVEITANTSSGVPSASEKDGAINQLSGSLYVWQVQTSQRWDIGASGLDDGSPDNTDWCSTDFAVFLRAGGSSTSDNVGSFFTDTTFTLDTANRVFSAYASDGSLLATTTNPSNWGRTAMYLYANSSGNAGDSVRIYMNKNTFPYDITQGDLGSYLAANPNWKQVGEV